MRKPTKITLEQLEKGSLQREPETYSNPGAATNQLKKLDVDNMTLKTKDCPDANGRTPQLGDVKYTLALPLENGETLFLELGSKGYEQMGQQLLDMMTNTPSYSDGSVDWDSK
jgi:hypothetical protein